MPHYMHTTEVHKTLLKYINGVSWPPTPVNYTTVAAQQIVTVLPYNVIYKVFFTAPTISSSTKAATW